jgi:hypothetical protein
MDFCIIINTTQPIFTKTGIVDIANGQPLLTARDGSFGLLICCSVYVPATEENQESDKLTGDLVR